MALHRQYINVPELRDLLFRFFFLLAIPQSSIRLKIHTSGRTTLQGGRPDRLRSLCTYNRGQFKRHPSLSSNNTSNQGPFRESAQGCYSAIRIRECSATDVLKRDHGEDDAKTLRRLAARHAARGGGYDSCTKIKG